MAATDFSFSNLFGQINSGISNVANTVASFYNAKASLAALRNQNDQAALMRQMQTPVQPVQPPPVQRPATTAPKLAQKPPVVTTQPAPQPQPQTQAGTIFGIDIKTASIGLGVALLVAVLLGRRRS